jgi:excinuclease ABC subunit B
LEAEMLAAADALEFERAAALRDRIDQMRGNVGKTVDSVRDTSSQPKGRRKGKSGGGTRVPRPKRG